MKHVRNFLLMLIAPLFLLSCDFFGTHYDVTFIYDEKVIQNGFTVGGKTGSRFPTDVGNDETLVGWYTDKNCTQLFTDFESIDNHITVYGKTVLDNNPSLGFQIYDYGKSFSVSLKKTSTETHVTVPDTFHDGRKVVKIYSPVGSYDDNYDELQKITIGKNMASMDYYSFNDCPNLSAIEVDTSNTNYKSVDGNVYSKNGKAILMYAVGKTDSNFVIPSTVTSIASNSFWRAKNLQTITFHNNVTSIGWEAFKESGLTTITIPPKVSVIHNGTFEDCTSLASINLGNIKEFALHYSNNSAFNGCTALEEITIPNGVTYLEDYTFAGLTALEKVVIPNSVVRVGKRLFVGSTNVSVHIAHKSRPFLWRYDWSEELREDQVVWNSKGA